MKPLRNDFVTSAYIFNKKHDKVLLILHKKLGKWLGAGGHLDPNELPHSGALREVQEETGLTDVKIIDFSPNLHLNNPVEMQLPTPFCILHEVIPATAKEEEHMHVDFVYIMETEQEAITLALGEVEHGQWFTLEEVEKLDAFEAVKKICRRVMQPSQL